MTQELRVRMDHYDHWRVQIENDQHRILVMLTGDKPITDTELNVLCERFKDAVRDYCKGGHR